MTLCWPDFDSLFQVMPFSKLEHKNYVRCPAKQDLEYMNKPVRQNNHTRLLTEHIAMVSCRGIIDSVTELRTTVLYP